MNENVTDSNSYSRDVEKNNPTDIVRSFLYQLYKLTSDEPEHGSLSHEIGRAIDESGQPKAKAYSLLWQIFATHIHKLRRVFIILDALDECQDPRSLIHGLQSISREKSIKVVVTSRREAHLDKQLSGGLHIDITPEDISADIHAFVLAKVSKSPRLSNPSIREFVIRRLSEGHDGMFLWVYLTLKELKTCYSVAEVRENLAKLPKKALMAYIAPYCKDSNITLGVRNWAYVSRFSVLLSLLL